MVCFSLASGTHTVCVCTQHDNRKLRLTKFKLELKSLIELSVCDTTLYDCMMHNCTKCPGIDAIKEQLHFIANENDYVTYKQWVSVDQTGLLILTEDANEFVDNLASSIWELTIHDFVAKSQAQSCSNLKEQL